MKIGKKNIIFLMFFIIIVLSLFPIVTYAQTIDDTFKGADDFISKGDTSVIDTSQLNSTSRFIYNMLLAVGMVVAVIVGMLLGIKYMTASAEDKAEVKETLVPYVIACCVVFGAFTIWKIVVNILK